MPPAVQVDSSFILLPNRLASHSSAAQCFARCCMCCFARLIIFLRVSPLVFSFSFFFVQFFQLLLVYFGRFIVNLFSFPFFLSYLCEGQQDDDDDDDPPLPCLIHTAQHRTGERSERLNQQTTTRGERDSLPAFSSSVGVDIY